MRCDLGLISTSAENIIRSHQMSACFPNDNVVAAQGSRCPQTHNMDMGCMDGGLNVSRGVLSND